MLVGSTTLDPASEKVCRLFVVDDIAENRAILTRRFQRHGFEITEAEDGFRALELAHQDFDLVLLDVMMPGIDSLADVLAGSGATSRTAA
jgi:CheY-like chemotaxis protein